MGAVACALYSGASAVGAWEIPEPKPSASFSDTHRIEDQPGVYRQVLNNGMELVVIADDSKVPNTSADDEQAMQLWLIVRAGSLYETPDQRGAARVLEEIIRMGTRTASDEHISDLLLNDVSWDTDLPGSFVGFDQAAFIARVDQNDPATMTQLIEFFTSLLDGNSLVLSDERIKQAIERVIEKISNEQDPEQRSRRRWLPRLMAKTPFGDRIPSPTIETLTRLTPESVRTFARQTYHPAQATLVALGVGDLSQVRSQLETQCSSIPDVGPSRMADGRNHLDSAMRSVLDVDPGFTESQAAMIWFHDRPMPTSTPETWYQR
ncbi:MAG: M16 family metallopeptidase, partial [Phycisphaerales bacterium]